ncbi:hypothetical protein KUF71_025380, partial [Frankliniella fusca]
MRVLSGTFDQSDFIRFSKYFGRQCTANAVAGACKANVVNPSLWTPQTIDECLMTGNRLFELSYELLPSTFNHLYLRPDELYSTVSFPENEITFQVAVNEVFDGTSINSIATVSNDGPTNYCLHDAILCFFHNFHYGIFTCQVESIAVMKIENEYYVFDSHKRCKNGLRDGANGAAVLVCFADINELIIHLKALYRCSRCCSAPTAVCSSCQFSISPLIITNVTNITYHAQSNANANSNVNNKRVSQLELARNAKKNKKTNKLLQKNKKVPAKKQIIVNNETPSSSPAELIDKIYDLRIRPTQVKYERTPEMKAKNVEQICKRYNTDVLVKKTKSKQVKEKYQNDKSFRESHSKKMHEKYNTNESFKISHSKKMQEKMREKYNTDESFKISHSKKMQEKMQEKYNTDDSFKISHSKKMQEKMQEKYNTDDSFKISHSKKMQEKMQEKYNTNDSFKNSHNTNMKQKYQTDANYHNKLLSNAKNSYQSLQGSKRKLNYQNLYHASKKTKISLQERFNEQKREMPTVICTCCAQLFFKKSTVHELTLKIDKSLRISDVCIYRSHLQENESGNVCSTCANHLKKGKVPHFAVVNGLLFEPLPEELTGLTTLEERLVSARIPFMQIRDNEDDPLQQAADEDDLTDQQETLLTSGFVADSGIKIAPGEGNMPLSLTLDEDMDVLAFPTVYGGKQRIFK